MALAATKDDTYGPAMQALSPSRREFVTILLDAPGITPKDAYRRAFPGAASDNGIGVNSHRLTHDQKILDAMHEEANKRLQSAAVLGASVLVEIARDSTHKDRLKAAMTLLNRIGLHERSEHQVTVKRPTDDVEIAQGIVELAKELGLDPRVLLGSNAHLVEPLVDKTKLIDGEVVDQENLIEAEVLPPEEEQW